jgi:hypothetical protein
MVRRVTQLHGQRDDFYRAIGRYFVQFSNLIAFMRTLVAIKIVGRDSAAETLIRLSFGSLQAQQVADAFFATCRTAANPALNTNELAIEKTLRENHINSEIRRRNVLAHGDWFVPALVEEWSEGAIDDPPPDPKAALIRVRHHKIDPLQPEDLTVEDIDRDAERIEALHLLAWEFGAICLEVEHHAPTDGRPHVRVEDAFELTGGANDRQVRFRPNYFKQLGVGVVRQI